jgi:hypothetical protein
MSGRNVFTGWHGAAGAAIIIFNTGAAKRAAHAIVVMLGAGQAVNSFFH